MPKLNERAVDKQQFCAICGFSKILRRECSDGGQSEIRLQIMARELAVR